MSFILSSQNNVFIPISAKGLINQSGKIQRSQKLACMQMHVPFLLSTE